VRVLERVGHLGDDVGGAVERDALGILQHLLQRSPLQELHRDVGGAGFLADIEDRHDVEMVQPPRGARLAQEANSHVADHVLRQVGQQRLEGDLALDERIDGAIYDSHGAAAKFAEDAVPPKRFQCHCRAFLCVRKLTCSSISPPGRPRAARAGAKSRICLSIRRPGGYNPRPRSGV
jgi:hypothetical protein